MTALYVYYFRITVTSENYSGSEHGTQRIICAVFFIVSPSIKQIAGDFDGLMLMWYHCDGYFNGYLYKRLWISNHLYNIWVGILEYIISSCTH